MTRILLTGASGFVGRQILTALEARGAEVRAILRPAAQRPAGAMEICLLEDLFAATLPELEAACTGIDTVIHAAWYAEPGHYLEAPQNLACLSGTLRLFEAAARAGVRRFVGVGTCFEYDLSAGWLRLDTPLAPNTLYGAAKASCFQMLSRMAALQGVSFAWCRLFYLHGEGEDPRRLVPYLRARLAAGEPAELSSGRQVRDYMDVRDAGDQIAFAALSAREGPLNICSGQPITIADLARGIASDCHRPDLLRFGARPDRAGDPPCVFGEPSFPGGPPDLRGPDP